jgi:hypothetical protein
VTVRVLNRAAIASTWGDQSMSPRGATHTLGNDNDVCSTMVS